MLEDEFNDCLSKAIRGHGCLIQHLAHAAGISEKSITECLQGKLNAATIRSIAPHLQLHADRLFALDEYQPTCPLIPGLTQVVSPFGHLGVNAYIITSGEINLVFDTGTDATDIHLLCPNAQHLFITHEHPDHIAQLSTFSAATIHLPATCHHGEMFTLGDFTLKVLDVSGHAAPARAYFISGLELPVCIVGDSIFAGSIGGCQTTAAYATALSNIKDHILSLPPQTILCPGHGPMTTVALEIENNPFF